MGVWALRSASVAWAELDCVATRRRITSQCRDYLIASRVISKLKIMEMLNEQ